MTAPNPHVPIDVLSLRQQCQRQAETIADLQRRLWVEPWVGWGCGIALGIVVGVLGAVLMAGSAHAEAAAPSLSWHTLRDGSQWMCAEWPASTDRVATRICYNPATNEAQSSLGSYPGRQSGAWVPDFPPIPAPLSPQGWLGHHIKKQCLVADEIEKGWQNCGDVKP